MSKYARLKTKRERPMTNEEIMLTIQRETLQAQQPLLDRVEKLERELDIALNGICVLNVLSGISMMNIPIASCRAVSDQLEKTLYELSEKEKTQAVIHGLANWMDVFSHQADALEEQIEERRKLHQGAGMEE